MRTALRRSALLLAAAGRRALAPGRPAQGEKLTLERLHAEPPLGGSLPTGLAWHPDGKRLTYLRHAATGRRPRGHRRGLGPRGPAPRRGQRQEPRHRQAPAPRRLPWCRGRERLLVSAAEATCSWWTSRPGVARALTRTPEAEELAQLSPDGRRVAFVRKNDLYVVEVQSGRETRLTKRRLRHRPERPPGLGLRGGAGQPERPGLLVGPRLRRGGLPAARPGAGAHLPHRGLPARSQRGEDPALPEGGRPERHRAGRAWWGSPRTERRAPSASSRSTPTTSTSCPTWPSPPTDAASPSPG